MIDFYGIITSVVPDGRFFGITVVERDTNRKWLISILSYKIPPCLGDVIYCFGNFLKDVTNEVIECVVSVKIRYPGATVENISNPATYVGKEVHIISGNIQ